jgi:hypothetical protein
MIFNDYLLLVSFPFLDDKETHNSQERSCAAASEPSTHRVIEQWTACRIFFEDSVDAALVIGIW